MGVPSYQFMPNLVTMHQFSTGAEMNSGSHNFYVEKSIRVSEGEQSSLWKQDLKIPSELHKATYFILAISCCLTFRFFKEIKNLGT